MNIYLARHEHQCSAHPFIPSLSDAASQNIETSRTIHVLRMPVVSCMCNAGAHTKLFHGCATQTHRISIGTFSPLRILWFKLSLALFEFFFAKNKFARWRARHFAFCQNATAQVRCAPRCDIAAAKQVRFSTKQKHPTQSSKHSVSHCWKRSTSYFTKFTW
jgi:hypothetical protein